LKVLILTVHFPPNIGGVETHLKDLVTYIVKKNWSVRVLCYQPLSSTNSWKVIEKSQNLKIIRIPWIRGLFYKLVPYPFLQFMYLFPGLFIITPFVILFENPKIIHAHGIVSGAVAVFWGKVFRKKIIISTHSLYSFPKKGFYRKFVELIFGYSDKILCLSSKSLQEVIGLGVDENKVEKFTYWIDLDKFKEVTESKKLYKWKEKFIVLFVGRLISEKGIEILLESFKSWDQQIGLVFAGTGPLEELIIRSSKGDERIHFLGKVSQDSLPLLYSSVNLVIVPSTSEEGFGRVIIESLACSTPVVASSRGSITEAMDNTVGEFIDIYPEDIKAIIESMFKNPAKLKKLKDNCRKYAERRYSEKNAEQIIRTYTE
jgi:glycosyltransferase involved in cell wall biosynthesis